jgi:hypothetical protein
LEEEEEPPSQTLSRSTWKITKPNVYNYSPFDFICTFSIFSNTNEPKTMKGTMEMEYQKYCRLAMDEEMDTLRNNDTWYLVPFPHG